MNTNNKRLSMSGIYLYKLRLTSLAAARKDGEDVYETMVGSREEQKENQVEGNDYS